MFMLHRILWELEAGLIATMPILLHGLTLPVPGETFVRIVGQELNLVRLSIYAE